MDKAGYIQYKNAIRRWQKGETSPSGIGGENMTENSSDAIIMHCGVCRGKQHFHQVETKRPGRMLLYKCSACGQVNRRPNPDQYKYPLGMFVLEKVRKDGLKGMSMEMYWLLAESGCPPIDERPFLAEKKIVLRGMSS